MANTTNAPLAATAHLVEWHYPEDLRSDDLIHVDERTLSAVVRTRRGRAGTEVISLADGREITVCGGTKIAVFTA